MKVCSINPFMKSVEEKNEEFVLNILHDIKSPILSINIALENIDPQTFGQNTADSSLLNEIYKVNRHNLEYIEKLMENYSVKKGRYQIKQEYFNILNIINEEIFALKFLIIEKNLKLNLVCSSETINVNSDKQLVRQVFLNLLTNAVKYSPNSEEIKIEISKNKKQVSICITNTVSNANTEHSTGLGLGIVKDVLLNLNGKVYHTKNKNKICFYIELNR